MSISLFFTLTFLLQLFCLYFFSRLLIKSLSQSIMRFTQNQTGLTFFLSFLFLPGTFIHETSHALMSLLCLVKVHSFSLIPHRQGDTLKLGSVEITKSDPFRKALIGTAPIVFGVTIMLLSAAFLESNWQTVINSWWQILLFGYLFFVISNTMFSSKKDLEGIWIVGLLLILILAFLIVFKIYEPFIWISNFLNHYDQFLLKLNLYLFIPIVIDATIYTFFKLFKIP